MADRPSEAEAEARFSRDDLVTLAMALEEFRDEYGPGRHDLAEKVNTVLRYAAGDEFVLAELARLASGGEDGAE